MNTDYELIHRLTLEELAEVISDEDLVYLKTTIREDPEAFNIWFETRNILNEPDVKEFLERSRPVEMIFQATLKGKKRPGSWKFYLLSIAAIIIVGLCLFHFYYPPVTRFPVTNDAFSNKDILLELPGSGSINLSDNHDSVKVNDVTIHHKGDSMTYAAAVAPRGMAKLTIPKGKDYKITLNDGTIIWLNSTTTLQFPLSFEGDTREISLNGEAYIEVAKSTTPFFVRLPGTTLQVLGTSFNVNTYDNNKVQIALVNGAVKVQDKILHPGQQLIYAPNSMDITSFDESALLGWRRGLYIFNNTSLSEIMQVIPRWFDKQVIMDNPLKGKSRFTGVIYKNEPVEYSLDILKATNDFDYYIQGDIIHIK
ncbi:FecR domain-containing protein [Chitinophaga sp.]|uniref:FecR family protein n=1 Tax=Chitinophaga sp. TaxID=1869181 RepID=UPI0031D4174A